MRLVLLGRFTITETEFGNSAIMKEPIFYQKFLKTLIFKMATGSKLVFTGMLKMYPIFQGRARTKVSETIGRAKAYRLVPIFGKGLFPTFVKTSKRKMLLFI